MSESGASVYSASQVAEDELPELDVSLRGAGKSPDIVDLFGNAKPVPVC